MAGPQSGRPPKAGRVGRPSRRAALALVLLGALAAIAAAWIMRARPGSILPPDPQTQALLEWAGGRGASLPSAVVGRACPTCPRGVFASRDLKPGDIIMRVPLTLALQLTVSNSTSDAESTAYDQAVELLFRMHADPSFNTTWGAYWASMPPVDNMLLAELFSNEQVGLLQHPALVAAATNRQRDASAVFANATNSTNFPPGVSLGAFNRIVAVVITRPFSPLPSASINSSYLLPLVDLINHSIHGNSRTKVYDGAFHTSATKSVRKGEEILHNYGHNLMHRADGSLFFYGFVEPSDTPLLCSVNLPPGYPPQSHNDSLYEDPALGFMTHAEHDRLAANLAAFPTTEAEDQALLKSGVFTDWRDQAILQTRLLCKRALRQTLDKLGAALRAGRVSPPAGEAQPSEQKLEL